MKPGPKPKPDSLTDAPVLVLRVPSKLLRSLTKGAKEAGMGRPAFIRMLLEHGLAGFKKPC